MSIELTDNQYLDLVLQARGAQKAPSHRLGCSGLIIGLLMLTMIGAFAILTAHTLGYIPSAWYGAYIGTPQTTFSTPAVPAQQQPVVQSQQRYTPFYSQPDAAPIAQPAPVLQGDLPGATATPMPTQEGVFWTPEEQTAFAVEATATSEAFYDSQTLATPEPTFVQYVNEQCQDAEKVKRSWLLQQMCTGGDE